MLNLHLPVNLRHTGWTTPLLGIDSRLNRLSTLRRFRFGCNGSSVTRIRRATGIGHLVYATLYNDRGIRRSAVAV